MVAIAKILIIDDSPKYLADALPLYGYEVDVATDGLQGIKKLTSEKNDYDLVLLDVMMPNMDGWETLKTIRTNKKLENIPVIMITALNEESDEFTIQLKKGKTTIRLVDISGKVSQVYEIDYKPYFLEDTELLLWIFGTTASAIILIVVIVYTIRSKKQIKNGLKYLRTEDVITINTMCNVARDIKLNEEMIKFLLTSIPL